METTHAEMPLCHILVVDDEPDVEPLIRQRLRRHVRKGQYTLRFASDGAQALETIFAHPEIEMVVTDINMPRMDGLTLLSELPSHAPDIKAVVMSAYGDIANIRTAMNRGAFDFVTKPLDFADFEKTLERTHQHIVSWKQAQHSRDRLNAELLRTDLASEMQQGILPVNFPDNEQLDMYGEIVPAETVGGDFFEVLSLDHGRIALAVADVSGTGIPAALFMMSSRTILRGAAIGHERPGSTLSEVNKLLQAENRNSMFTTLVYAVYDPETGSLRYANAGHCNPIVIAPSGESRELPAAGEPPVGVDRELSYQEFEAHLARGETLILYSDGFTKSTDNSDSELGTQALRKALEQAPPQSAVDAIRQTMGTLRSAGHEAERTDDVTCLALHRKHG